MNPNKKRLRRTMMFLNCQKPGLIKDPYIYKPDSIMLDLEDAVAENQKDAARYSLYHALQEIDYRGVERVVRINGLDGHYSQILIDSRPIFSALNGICKTNFKEFLIECIPL